jgi:hypothetical protein
MRRAPADTTGEPPVPRGVAAARGSRPFVALALALLVAGSAGAARADGASAVMSFTVGEDRVLVASEGLSEVTLTEPAGLRFCLREDEQRAVNAFTERHVGEVVTVKIGDEVVISPRIGAPHTSACINWPISRERAAHYLARLKPDAAPPAATQDAEEEGSQ